MIRHTHLKISGGLGNQLFQYAFALFIHKTTGKKVFLDGRGYRTKLEHDGFLLPQLFKEDRNLQFLSRPKSLFDSYAWKDFEFVESTEISPFELIHHKTPFSFRPQRVTLKGHWQWYLWPHISAEIFDKIKLPKPKDTRPNQVMIHIRGGDYLANYHTKRFYGTITKNYYSDAIEFAKSRNSAVQFRLFTDDVKHAKSILRHHLNDCEVDNSTSTLQALANMKACSGAIMANSSFSWWGAFLQKQKGLQFAPAIWNSKQIEESAFIFPPYVKRIG